MKDLGSMTSNSGKFKISLLENGMHSLDRTIEVFKEFTATDQDILLKETIIFFHHAIELLLKQVLVEHSEYLIFENLGDAAKKQRVADEQSLPVFFLEKPPRTVSFDEAIRRVRAFVKTPELDEALVGDLRKLNNFRNQLEHYAINADKEEITNLVADTYQPLLKFFAASIKGFKPTDSIRRISEITKEPSLFHSRLEEDVSETVSKFSGQEVPGRLFNQEGTVFLPLFSKIHPNPSLNTSEGNVLRPDLIAQSDLESWIIEVKSGLTPGTAAIQQVLSYALATGFKPWLILFSNPKKSARDEAASLRVMLTGQDEWNELKKLLG